MSLYDFSAQRLFVETPLNSGTMVSCSRDQVNYLVNVLRLKKGENILLFNGRDGEWRAELFDVAKRTCTLHVLEQVRPQVEGPDLTYVFAPLKKARMDYMVQKATELGASVLQPVLTHRTQSQRVNLARLRANAIEASEQCGILSIPVVKEVVKLKVLLGSWPQERRLIYCDESAELSSPVEVLKRIPEGPVAVLIGPEGGFDAEERAFLRGLSFVTPVSLGPRIMRADTAAVAALALVNAMLGDWR